MTQPGWLDSLDEPQAPQPDWMRSMAPETARPLTSPDWLAPPYQPSQPVYHGIGPARQMGLPEKVGRAIGNLVTDFGESINVAPELFGGKPISLRERAGRAFNIASFFIPVGKLAKGASLLTKAALRGGAFGAIGAASAAIRGHPVTPAFLGSALFGGGLEFVGGGAARLIRQRNGAALLAELDRDPTAFAHPSRTPLNSGSWSIVNAMHTSDKLRLNDEVNEQLHEALGKALKNEGWQAREVYGFGPGQAKGEKSWFVPGMGEREALEWNTLGRFPQEWVLTSDGLIDMGNGTRQAIQKGSTRFDANVDPKADTFTEMMVGGQTRRFTFNFGEPQQINPRATSTEASDQLLSLMKRDNDTLWSRLKALPNEVQWRSLLSHAYTRYVRSFAGLENAEGLLGKPTGQRLVEDSAGKLAQLSSSWPAFAEHAMRFGLVDFKNRTRILKRAFLDILGGIRGNEKELFETYGLARRLRYLGEEHGYKLPAGQTLDGLKAHIVDMEERFPHFKKVFEEVQDWHRTMLRNWLVDSGLVGEQAFNEAMAHQQDYVPLAPTKRAEGGMVKAGPFVTKTPVKPLGELADEFHPWIEQMAHDVYGWSREAHRREIAATFVKMLEEADPSIASKFAVPIAEAGGAPAVEGASKETSDVLSNWLSGTRNDPALSLAPSPVGAQPADVVIGMTKPDGTFSRYRITDPDIYEAFQAMNPAQQNIFFRLAAGVAATLRAGATLSFEFMARNPLRDVLFAKTTSGAPIHDFLGGFASAFKQDEMYKKFLASGGSRATLISMDLPAIRKGVEEAIGREASLGTKVANVIKYPYQGLQAMSDFLETGTRLGAFKRRFAELTQGGMSPAQATREAALHARNVTVDFSVHGSRTSSVRMMAAFWNAQIQGYDRLVRAFAKDPQGVAMRVMAYITVPSVALYLLNRDDPEYKQLPAWEKNMFWHVKAPDWVPGLGDHWIRFPKPYDLGLVFGSSVERFLEYVDEQDPKALDAMATNYVQKVFQDLVPIPTIARPLIENAVNYSFLRGRPIESRSLEDVAPEFRQQPGTSEVAKGLGRMLGVSPVKLDNLLYGYTGGLGRLGVDAVDLAIGLEKGEAAFKGAPVFDPRAIPGLRGFVSQFPRNAEPIDKLYEFADRTREASNTAQFLERTFQIDDLVDWLQQKSFLLGAQDTLKDVISQMRQLRQFRDAVMQNDSISPREKSQTLNAVDNAMLSLAMSMQPLISAADRQEEQK